MGNEDEVEAGDTLPLKQPEVLGYARPGSRNVARIRFVKQLAIGLAAAAALGVGVGLVGSAVLNHQSKLLGWSAVAVGVWLTTWFVSFVRRKRIVVGVLAGFLIGVPVGLLVFVGVLCGTN